MIFLVWDVSPLGGQHDMETCCGKKERKLARESTAYQKSKKLLVLSAGGALVPLLEILPEVALVLHLLLQILDVLVVILLEM